MSHTVTIVEDAGSFLETAHEFLSADPVVASVVTTAATRVRDGLSPATGPYRWFSTVNDGDRVIGVAMRTATFEPYPVYVLPMRDDAADALARAVIDRGEPVTAVYGSSPTAERLFAQITGVSSDDTRLDGRLRLRLHVLASLVTPETPGGGLRAPDEDEAGLLVEWLSAFMREADEQAGRAPGTSPQASPDRAEVLARIERGGLWVWEDGEGAPVHVLGTSGPHLGVARVGPVYTPPDRRGCGYAAAAVAAISARLTAEGARVCLYTDLDNPTSNALYARLGYVAVGESTELRLPT